MHKITQVWRNWQTREFEGLVAYVSWEFDPPLLHHGSILPSPLRQAERL